MNLFYAADVNSDLAEFVLPKEESKHLLVSRRTNVDDDFYITNGKGEIFKSKIKEITKKNIIIHKIKSFEKQDEPTTSLAVCPTKMMSRTELIVEKCTEIGIKEIILFYGKNSERKSIKTDRLQRIAISAMKQSLRAWMPQIIEIKDLKELYKYYKGDKYIAHCYTDKTRKKLSKLKPNKESLIMIGPEGDFSKVEVNAAEKNGCTAISLGNRRLRTETAAIVAVSRFNID